MKKSMVYMKDSSLYENLHDLNEKRHGSVDKL